MVGSQVGSAGRGVQAAQQGAVVFADDHVAVNDGRFHAGGADHLEAAAARAVVAVRAQFHL